MSGLSCNFCSLVANDAHAKDAHAKASRPATRLVAFSWCDQELRTSRPNINSTCFLVRKGVETFSRRVSEAFGSDITTTIRGNEKSHVTSWRDPYEFGSIKKRRTCYINRSVTVFPNSPSVLPRGLYHGSSLWPQPPHLCALAYCIWGHCLSQQCQFHHFSSHPQAIHKATACNARRSLSPKLSPLKRRAWGRRQGWKNVRTRTD